MTAAAPRAAMAGAGVVGRDPIDGLIGRDVVQQVKQHGRIADPASGDLDRPEFQRLCVDPEVNLAPVAWLGRPTLPSQPITIAFGFHTGAVDQEVQGTRAGSVRDVDGQSVLATAKGAEVRHRPVQPGKLRQARHHAGRLPTWQAK